MLRNPVQAHQTERCAGRLGQNMAEHRWNEMEWKQLQLQTSEAKVCVSSTMYANYCVKLSMFFFDKNYI